MPEQRKLTYAPEEVASLLVVCAGECGFMTRPPHMRVEYAPGTRVRIRSGKCAHCLRAAGEEFAKYKEVPDRKVEEIKSSLSYWQQRKGKAAEAARVRRRVNGL